MLFSQCKPNQFPSLLISSLNEPYSTIPFILSCYLDPERLFCNPSQVHPRQSCWTMSSIRFPHESRQRRSKPTLPHHKSRLWATPRRFRWRPSSSCKLISHLQPWLWFYSFIPPNSNPIPITSTTRKTGVYLDRTVGSQETIFAIKKSLI